MSPEQRSAGPWRSRPSQGREGLARRRFLTTLYGEPTRFLIRSEPHPMTRPARSACVLAALTLLLAGCAQTPVNEMGTAATTASTTAAAPAEAPPVERHEASAQCWMKYDKSGGSLEAKAKLVDKCIAEKTKTAAKP
jgi:hypothetical protein